MKNLLQIIVKIIGLGNKKIVDLDNDGKIETLREEISGLFSQFHTMSKTLDEANGKLEEVIQDETVKQEREQQVLQEIIAEVNRKIEESNKRVNKAQSQIESNDKLNAKVKEFIV